MCRPARSCWSPVSISVLWAREYAPRDLKPAVHAVCGALFRLARNQKNLLVHRNIESSRPWLSPSFDVRHQDCSCSHFGRPGLTFLQFSWSPDLSHSPLNMLGFCPRWLPGKRRLLPVELPGGLQRRCVHSRWRGNAPVSGCRGNAGGENEYLQHRWETKLGHIINVNKTRLLGERSCRRSSDAERQRKK